MNDPEVDTAGAAHEASQTVDNMKGDDNAQSHPIGSAQQNTTATTKARWWYASTAFPLIAGTFGPMANAFSICALVENWRVEIPPGGTEEHGIDIRDPRWLIAVNSVSLAFALIANMSLLLNMAKRLRFEIAQPITILGFSLASLLLIGLISYASTEGFHKPGVSNQALTQAYYYGIFAAGLYQIISCLMCITVWGAYRGAYSKDFELTVAQRTLMLQTISFLVYLLVGALIYSHIEGWKFLDAVYFMDFTLLTVGIGDYAPSTQLGRGLLFPIAAGGIVTIGLVVSSIRTMLLDRGAEKLSARVQEKTRRRVIRQVEAIKKQGKAPKKPYGKVKASTVEKLAEDPSDDTVDELERRKAEFEAMRNVQDMSNREHKFVSLFFSTSAFTALWFIGAVVFWRAERNQQWSYFESLYFSYTSIITIGYGDFSPMSNSGKPFFVFWSLLAVPSLTILISDMGDTVVKGIKDLTIWLGEISVLPSSDARMRDRLKKGASRTRLGQWLPFITKDVTDEEDNQKHQEADEAWAGFKELHPGLINIFDDSDQANIDPSDLHVLDRLASAWARSEEQDEHGADHGNDDRTQAEHHYRHLLIQHIPRLYADTKLKVAKRYSYAQWAFYLRLIGEDESDSTSHRRAVLKAGTQSHPRNKAKHSHNSEGPTNDQAPTGGHERKEAETRPQWSWIGPSSPLMQDKDEAEWILERLFERLEESLRSTSHDAKQEHKTPDSAAHD